MNSGDASFTPPLTVREKTFLNLPFFFSVLRGLAGICAPGGHLQLIQIVTILSVKRKTKDEVKVIRNRNFHFYFPLMGKLSILKFKNSLNC